MSDALTVDTSTFAAVATSGSYNDLEDKPTIPTVPNAIKNPSALTISLNGTSQGAYDGSAAKSINVTAASVGAAAASHSHPKSQITDFPTSMPASDVKAWAKADTKPSYSKAEVGLGNVDNTADSEKSVKYATSAGSAGAVAWANVSGKPSTFTPSSHTHDDRYYTESEINAKLAAETQARTDADAALDTAYKAADTALGSRIDNAETEISANSADLTGIKGLTYGTQHVNFLESSNGEYTSPALEEIAERIAQGMTCIQIQADATTMDAATLNKLSSDWPNVALIDTTPDPNNSRHEFKFPIRESRSKYTFTAIGGHYRDGQPYATNIVIKKTGEIIRNDVTNDPYWSNIIDKPFDIIGDGLSVNPDTKVLSVTNYNNLATNNIVMVQSSQPTDSHCKIWIKP